MTITEWNIVKIKWSTLTDVLRWKFIKSNQHLNIITNLDNDNTFITNSNIEDESLQFDEFIGNKKGIKNLLVAMNIKYKEV